MSRESNITIAADSVDGLNWQKKLDEAFLLATDISEGWRPAEELLRHINQWWHDALDDEKPPQAHGADEPLSS